MSVLLWQQMRVRHLFFIFLFRVGCTFMCLCVCLNVFRTYRFNSLSCFVLGVTSFFFTLFLSSSLYALPPSFLPSFFPSFFFLCSLFSSLKSPRFPHSLSPQTSFLFPFTTSIAKAVAPSTKRASLSSWCVLSPFSPPPPLSSLASVPRYLPPPSLFPSHTLPLSGVTLFHSPLFLCHLQP